MPSLVSMPPNIMTAASDVTSGLVRVAVALASTPAAPLDGPVDVASERSDSRRRVWPDLAARRHPIDRGDDLVVPAEHDRGLDLQQLERLGDDRDGEWPGQVAPDLRPAGRSQVLDEPARYGFDQRGESAASLGLQER